jgi:hypothetical protein
MTRKGKIAPSAIRNPSNPRPRERERVAKPDEGAQARVLNSQSAIRNPQSAILGFPFTSPAGYDPALPLQFNFAFSIPHFAFHNVRP